ncbi:MAG: hypothetical protein ABIP51_23590 [Bacteroidia bacterium]
MENLKKRKQKEKIDWVSLNIKPVEIIIIKGKESWELFKKEVTEKTFLLDDIKIKYNTYKK